LVSPSQRMFCTPTLDPCLTCGSNAIAFPPARLRRVTDYIEANLDRPVSLVTLANVAGLSVFHFARVFQETTEFARASVLLAQP